MERDVHTYNYKTTRYRFTSSKDVRFDMYDFGESYLPYILKVRKSNPAFVNIETVDIVCEEHKRGGNSY